MLKAYKEPKIFEYTPEENVPDDLFADYVKRHTADKVVVYKKTNEDLKIAWFFPEDFDPSKKYPTFVMIHGGGWASRNKMADQQEWAGDYLGYMLRYFADKGCVGAMITYTLLKPETGVELIDLLADCQDGMNYIADHAAEYGVDLDNVVLLGESAGGHLAGSMVTDSLHENRLPLKAGILADPITNLFNDVWGRDIKADIDRPFLKDMIKSEAEMALSPLFNIHKGMPKIALVHGDADPVVNINQSYCFNRRMAMLGEDCELHVIKGATHAFLLREYYNVRSHTKLGVEIVESYLKKIGFLG